MAEIGLPRVDQNVGLSEDFGVLRELGGEFVHHLGVLTRLKLDNLLESRTESPYGLRDGVGIHFVGASCAGELAIISRLSQFRLLLMRVVVAVFSAIEVNLLKLGLRQVDGSAWTPVWRCIYGLVAVPTLAVEWSLCRAHWHTDDLRLDVRFSVFDLLGTLVINICFLFIDTK